MEKVKGAEKVGKRIQKSHVDLECFCVIRMTRGLSLKSENLRLLCIVKVESDVIASTVFVS
jgi:hypothetical protein